MKLQRLINSKTIFFSLAFFSASLYAEAPSSDGLGDVKNNIELRGAVINAGASIGGFKGGGLEMETSIGTIHGDSTATNVTNNILVYGLLGGISVVNAAVTWQGNLCSKVAIGSLGASTCTYGSGSNIGHALKETQ
jgi:hypothetical protein